MLVNVYDKKAKEIGNMELSDEVFAKEYNEAIIHQCVVAQMNNMRQGTKSTLTRTEVRGGGKKPWRQKGTGNARQGSIRAPQWIKGGVVFAPKPRDFSQKVNGKMRKAALKSAISYKFAHDEAIIVDSLALEAAKTKEIASVLKNFKLEKSVLIVLGDHDDNAVVAARNIPGVTTVNADLISVLDVVASAKCLITKEAAEQIEKNQLEA
ncbi:MAG: 50S ribosomal protein L4 [Clostridia bacterium]|nr:50S ribosomal protein L4 [Clostridia bacterium]